MVELSGKRVGGSLGGGGGAAGPVSERAGAAGRRCATAQAASPTNTVAQRSGVRIMAIGVPGDGDSTARGPKRKGGARSTRGAASERGQVSSPSSVIRRPVSRRMTDDE